MSRLPPFVAYSLSRLGLFLVPFVLLLLLNVTLMWAVLIAFVLSSLVSIVVLSRQRDRVSTSLVERRERIQQTMAERTAAEDAWDDATRTSGEPAAADASPAEGDPDTDEPSPRRS